MQTKTFFSLFCTIAVLLITANDGAPTTPGTAKKQPTVVTETTPSVRGGRTTWAKKIDPARKKLFNDYKKIISKKLQTLHKVPATFKPKPDKVSSQTVSGTLYHYLVKLPTKQYAYVTILSQQWKKNEYGSEGHVTVRPQLYALTDKDI